MCQRFACKSLDIAAARFVSKLDVAKRCMIKRPYHDGLHGRVGATDFLVGQLTGRSEIVRDKSLRLTVATYQQAFSFQDAWADFSLLALRDGENRAPVGDAFEPIGELGQQCSFQRYLVLGQADRLPEVGRARDNGEPSF